MLALVAAVAAVVAAGVFARSGGAAPRAAGAADRPQASHVTRVTVNATEFKFALSRRSAPLGTVIFKVVNKGKAPHDFKIAGKKTRTLPAGKSQTITVVFRKRGRYAYLCTLLGHAKLGMKGSFAIATAPAPPPPPTPPPPPPPPTPPPSPPPPGPATTVQVGMFEYRFDMSQSTIPQGTVTFVITNKGQEVHNFSITGIKGGQFLAPGQTETYTVGLAAGTYGTICDVPFHADRGMVGQITITPPSPARRR
jgi:uncharacterized cupredoxin-like copper-binding protein